MTPICFSCAARAPALLFVYGTLRPGSDVPLARRLAAEARHLGAARASGRLYDLGAYPGMTDGAPGERVTGDVFELADPARVLRVLDDYEGCGASDPPPHTFARVERRVVLADGRELAAWLYLAPGAAAAGERMTAGDWQRRGCARDRG
jgi:gamma-glutamylcyclotransferase (GGCT)/AIG2-like uncharacterized protein YtfP